MGGWKHCISLNIGKVICRVHTERCAKYTATNESVELSQNPKGTLWWDWSIQGLKWCIPEKFVAYNVTWCLIDIFRLFWLCHKWWYILLWGYRTIMKHYLTVVLFSCKFGWFFILLSRQIVSHPQGANQN